MFGNLIKVLNKLYENLITEMRDYPQFYLFGLFVGVMTFVESRDGVRGISPNQEPFYRPAKDFRCLDGSQTIPYDRVNDDYCDCSDSSDEPGTSACPNGSFHCTNAGYKSYVIPSSRVNDGICDCCDGADEYSHRVTCGNLCVELGQQMREEAVKQHQLLLEGHKVYGEYCVRGQQAITEKQARLVDLEKEKGGIEAKRADLEAVKSEAEKTEKEAKDVHKQQWEAQKEKLMEEKKKIAALEAFEELDSDQNNLVSIQEIQSHAEFDIDSNGEVSSDEAKEYLEEHDEIDFDDFLAKVWDNINQIYRKPGSEKVEPPEAKEELTTPTPEASDGGDDDDEGEGSDEGEGNEDDEADDDKEDEQVPQHDDKKKEVKPEDQDLPMPDYDEPTKRLIEVADAARDEFNSADSKYRSIENEISEIKKLFEFDLGPNNEFFALKGQCFDFTDREYVYSLCPFERASQRSKHGGSETSLGNWGLWSGPSNSKYSAMKYERGQSCWNGPDRSANVVLQCGMSNELISVSEPNRCEYRFVFNTPAVCSQKPEPPQPHFIHEDL